MKSDKSHNHKCNMRGRQITPEDHSTKRHLEEKVSAKLPSSGCQGTYCRGGSRISCFGGRDEGAPWIGQCIVFKHISLQENLPVY